MDLLWSSMDLGSLVRTLPSIPEMAGTFTFSLRDWAAKGATYGLNTAREGGRSLLDSLSTPTRASPWAEDKAIWVPGYKVNWDIHVQNWAWGSGRISWKIYGVV